MKTLIFSATLTVASCLTAQTEVIIYNVRMNEHKPIGEWYLLVDEKDYEGVYNIDFTDENLAEEQINSTLEELGTSMEFGNLVEHVDGFYYYEWDGLGKDLKGNPAPAYVTYMMNRNDPNFFRISIYYP